MGSALTPSPFAFSPDMVTALGGDTDRYASPYRQRSRWSGAHHRPQCRRCRWWRRRMGHSIPRTCHSASATTRPLSIVPLPFDPRERRPGHSRWNRSPKARNNRSDRASDCPTAPIANGSNTRVVPVARPHPRTQGRSYSPACSPRWPSRCWRKRRSTKSRML